MRFLAGHLSTPAENLACDEALLDACEEGTGPPVLRVWTTDAYFVVLGSTSSVSGEVYAEVCRSDGIPILRRPSGGSTVLQGPGCLSYALVLDQRSHPALQSIAGTNAYVLERVADAVQSVVPFPVDIRGHTDLAINERKVSGNAQRRKARSLLFHGTLLLTFDIARIGRYLTLPPRQPAYRAQRRHDAFLTNLGVSPSTMTEALRSIWHADEPCPLPSADRIADLVRSRYADDRWTWRRP
jgi:lipoate-protein ligase A